MEVIVRPDASAAEALVARLIEARLRERSDLVLGLATGRTMERVYARLVESGVSFARARTFNLDEYVGLPPDDPNSYRHVPCSAISSTTWTWVPPARTCPTAWRRTSRRRRGPTSG